MRASLLPMLALCLSACVIVRAYSERDLAGVAEGCGFAAGEVVQEADYPKLLFLLAEQPSPEQFACIRQWSRKHNLHLSFIDGIEFQTDGPSN